MYNVQDYSVLYNNDVSRLYMSDKPTKELKLDHSYGKKSDMIV